MKVSNPAFVLYIKNTEINRSYHDLAGLQMAEADEAAGLLIER